MKSSLTDAENAALAPWPRTATNVITDSPIIRAPAVAAVRDGLRIAFCRASSPAEPPMRAPGAPRTDASGLVRRGAAIESPRDGTTARHREPAERQHGAEADRDQPRLHPRRRGEDAVAEQRGGGDEDGARADG